MDILSAFKDYCIQEHPTYEDEINAASTAEQVTIFLESQLYDDEIVDLLARFLDDLISNRITEAKLTD